MHERIAITHLAKLYQGNRRLVCTTYTHLEEAHRERPLYTLRCDCKFFDWVSAKMICITPRRITPLLVVIDRSESHKVWKR